MDSVWIAFGSNQDQPIEQLLQARSTLSKHQQLNEDQASSIYQTPPWGFVEQPDFYNAVIRYQTTLNPYELLDLLQSIEQKQHRIRTIKNGPRTLDLDILLYGNQKIVSDNLQIPHPRMLERAFVLVPLYEINSQLDLANGQKIDERLKEIDCDGLKKLNLSQWEG